MGPIGIFGGTFDPIHHGHLRTALELAENLALSEVRFIPCGQQPLRGAPVAAGSTRLSMVRAAVRTETRFSVDTRELDRDGPSYTVDTLLGLRQENPDRSLCLLLGMDAFSSLPRWHRWEELLELAHVIVAHRPGWHPPTEGGLREIVGARAAAVPRDLLASAAGRIFVAPVTPLDISATGLRTLIGEGLDPRYLVPDEVRDIILETECYGGGRGRTSHV